MADEDRDPEGPGAEVSEAQIAVHWRVPALFASGLSNFRGQK